MLREDAAGERVVEDEGKCRSEFAGFQRACLGKRRQPVQAVFPALDLKTKEVIPAGQLFPVGERTFGERL